MAKKQKKKKVMNEQQKEIKMIFFFLGKLRWRQIKNERNFFFFWFCRTFLCPFWYPIIFCFSFLLLLLLSLSLSMRKTTENDLDEEEVVWKNKKRKNIILLLAFLYDNVLTKMYNSSALIPIPESLTGLVPGSG